MPSQRAYLDWNASAPILPEVSAAVTHALGLGNPSSTHSEGRAARAAVERARAEVAALAGVDPAQVTFTSGATEAAVMALQPVVAGEMLLVGAGEHPCVRSGGRFPNESVREVAIDAEGRVDFVRFGQWFAQLDSAAGLVHLAVQAVNNETGVINDLDALAGIRTFGCVVTCDAVQAAGRIDLAKAVQAADYVLLSAHKIGGPKGVGAIITRKDGCGGLRPLILGGGQERSARAGTENVAGIVGFGVAARIAVQRLGDMARIAALRDRFEADLKAIAPDAVVFGAGAPRIGNTSLFAIPGMRAETMLIAFDLDGVAVSSGAACSSGKVGRSTVLKAMGVSDTLAAGAIRMSIGWSTTEADLDRCLASLDRQIKRMRAGRQSAA